MAHVNSSLHIGINYPGTDAELAGCVNDAQSWAQIAADRGLAPQLLLEQAATREAILAAISDAVDRVGWRARGLLTFSGHGTPVPDLDGDEVNGFDEALVPADYATAGVITDDDLYEILGHRRAGARWVTISDACYSGHLQRFCPAGPAAGARPRYLPPGQVLPADLVTHVRGELIAQGITGAAVADDPVVVPRKLARRVAPRTSGLLLSACAEAEVAYDATIAGRAQGAFSWAAMDALTRDDVGRGLPDTYGAWFAAIRRRLPDPRYPQSPQLQAGAWQRRWQVLR